MASPISSFRALRRRLSGGVALTLAAHLACVPVAQADVSSQMNNFFSEAGGAANITGPSAYQGQSAGYYSMGNVWTRFPQKSVQPFNLQLPSVRAGCGGIDLFSGSFSFINASEMVAMLKATANNALGFAFKLAIDSVSPQIGKIMEEFAQKAQLLNQMNISSCEAAQAIVGNIATKLDTSRSTVCTAIGNSQGKFSDWASARQGCNNGNQQNSTMAGNNDPLMNGLMPGEPRNYTWEALKKSDKFGAFDKEFSEYIMTLVGTVVTAPGTGDGQTGNIQTIGPAEDQVITALLDGTDGNSTKVLRCVDEDKCLQMENRNLNVPASSAIRPRIKSMIQSMSNKVRTDEALTNEEKQLLNIATIPLYKILTVQAYAHFSLTDGEIDALAEIVSVDILSAIIDNVMDRVGQSRNTVTPADLATQEIWQRQFAESRAKFAQRDLKLNNKLQTTMAIINRSIMTESTLQNSMSPGMSAALNFSRGLNAQGLQ